MNAICTKPARPASEPKILRSTSAKKPRYTLRVFLRFYVSFYFSNT